MRGTQQSWTMTLLAGIVLWASGAPAQITGSFDGQVAGPRVAVPLNTSAALLQMGPFVTGTLAIGSVAPEFAGIYTLTGKATTQRLRVSGLSDTGALLKWRAKIAGGVMAGRVACEDA